VPLELSNKATRLLEESVKSTKEIALLKAETVKLEKEISEIKKTKSVVLQTVSTTFSDPQSMDMEGHTLYQIALRRPLL
jgi:predicted  nucleic acid-binding Zn-ribbon protein